MNPARALWTIKLIHTLIWAFFAGCIVAIPFFGHAGRFVAAGLLIAVVTLEVLVIIVNRGRCPLTDLAERYTGERQENFDIFLPLWLARYNKLIFGTLFVAGLLYTLVKWLGSHAAA